MQPKDFKGILKSSIKSLTCYCAFDQGYIPMENQTDLFIQLAVESACELNKLHYAARLRKDNILQKEVCDLVRI
jgi:hypothetical protein